MNKTDVIAFPPSAIDKFAPKSKTAWHQAGYRVMPDQEPHDVIHRWQYPSYAVYRFDQVIPRVQRKEIKPQEIPILAAVWAVNRRAKRCREMAQSHYCHGSHGLAGFYKSEKEQCYELKGQALHYLHESGELVVTGYHRFPGGNWGELLTGGGYRFHRPCEPRDEVPVDIGDIEAKPREHGEPRLKDALHTLELFLVGKPYADVYEWPWVPRTAMAS